MASAGVGVADTTESACAPTEHAGLSSGTPTTFSEPAAALSEADTDTASGAEGDVGESHSSGTRVNAAKGNAIEGDHQR